MSRQRRTILPYSPATIKNYASCYSDVLARHSAPPPRESSKTILSTPRTDGTELFAGFCYFYVLVETSSEHKSKVSSPINIKDG